MTRTKAWLGSAAGAIGVAMVATAALYPGGAQAGTTDATSAGTTAVIAESEPSDGTSTFRLHGRRGGGNGEHVAALAAKLGISEDELQAAISEVRDEAIDERLDEALLEGKLTREQADDIREARENGTVPEFLRERMGEKLSEGLANAVETGRISQADADTLLQAFEDGTLSQTAEELGIDLPKGRRHHRGHGGFGGFGPGVSDVDASGT